MSKYKYEFGLSIGFPSAEHNEVVDLVDDWGYDESDLDGRAEEDIEFEIREALRDWADNYIEYWHEKVGE